MKILKSPELFTQAQISTIEKMKNAVYVCDTCIKTPMGWQSDSSVAVFWNTNPDNIPEGGSPWFGLHFDMDHRLMICNAITAVEEPITGVIAANGDIIYSRYRHDYRTSPDGTAMVDGGRDYFRTGPIGIGTAELRIVEGELKVTALRYSEGKRQDDAN